MGKKTKCIDCSKLCEGKRCINCHKINVKKKKTKCKDCEQCGKKMRVILSIIKRGEGNIVRRNVYGCRKDVKLR